MEHPLLISWLNDYVFCPASVYFHCLYADVEPRIYQDVPQVSGTNAHERVDQGVYSTSKDVVSGMSVFSEELGLIGKIDIFNVRKGELIERKNKIDVIYDGYVFQLYAQCVCLREMGYKVDTLTFHSIKDNKSYDCLLPEDDAVMHLKFLRTIEGLRSFDMKGFSQGNIKKCENCIYEPICGGARGA